MRISCFLIGENRLLTACADMLIERGHDLRGVITASPEVAQWATAQEFNVIDADGDYAAALDPSTFDYLFSLAHLAIIPAKVLRLPRRGAINFHDGLLPRYAGLNVPAWALLHGETTHGITWHLMTEQPDTGDVLKQVEFSITDQDSALTLNAKCFDAGLKTFGPLIDELAAGSLRPMPQDLTGRRYFSRVDRPSGGCFLDFRQPAVDLDRLVRATEFGDYLNPFGVAKLSVFGQDLIATASRPVLDEAVDDQRELPGTIREIRDDRLHVDTGHGVLILEGFAQLDGRPLTARDVIESLGLQVGDRLDAPSDAIVDRRTKDDRRSARDEAFWVSRLTALQPVQALGPPGEVLADPGIASVPVAIPSSFLERFGDALDEAIAAAFAVFLALVHAVARFDLSLDDGAADPVARDDESWLNRRVPLNLNFHTQHGLDQAIDVWRQERQRVARRSLWLRDLVSRTPPLRQRPELRGGRLNITGVQMVHHLADRPIAPDWTAPVLVVSRRELACELSFGRREFSVASARQFSRRLSSFLGRVAADPTGPLDRFSCLTPDEEQELLVDWNRTAAPYSRTTCVHQLFEQQVKRTPTAVALVFEDQSLTYDELNRRANQLAAHLRVLGVGPDQLVGVFVERSVEMVVAILAVQKAGGAYVPLDPAFPPQRLAFMLHDSHAPVVITQSHLLAKLPPTNIAVVRIDGDWPTISEKAADDVGTDVSGHHLAYLIYTSGSTGRPKGVMVEHRNVVNFFTAMDQRVGFAVDRPNVLLAVTSLSFDISVLELLWTLSRGFKVILYAEWHRPALAASAVPATTPMRFGLFYFASDEGEPGEDKYRLLIEGARFADANGFVSVSTPERHFHAFGGLYPNPAVTGAALAMITQHVQIRAGSVVVPLHHPIRIVEEWALVDNLSQGRVGLSFASGWQPVDFVIRPEAYRERHRYFYEGIESVRRLWRGEGVKFATADGEEHVIRTLPRPIQPELPTWVTTAGSLGTWLRAAELGANVLTHLLGQTIDELADKIGKYRETFRAAGHAGQGSVTLMLHSFVGDVLDQVREMVRGPLTNYLGSALSLVKDVASSWAAFKRRTDGTVIDAPDDLNRLTTQDRADLLDFSFERYFSTSGLFGTPSHCVALVHRLRAIGVDEIACLIDFGIDTETVLNHLQHLNQVRIQCERDAAVVVPDAIPASGPETVGALMRHHRVTHLQCTPSMASLIVADTPGREAMRGLRTMMIGGEALSAGLAKELRAATDARLINMYGPTETTIWSSTHEIAGNETSTIPLGRPVANTQFYLLDDRLRPVPVGEVGELYIGGDGVARGYHHRPQLTAERFIGCPFQRPPDHVDGNGNGEEAQGKIYRTGDVARYRPDGVVEFLGRVDHQVKIRGYRIELGEIEAALAQHSDIREVVVMAREDVPGDRRLVAYYAGDPQHPIDDADLRSMLNDRLPAYMVPSHFVVLERFPLTPNGKVDRRALPSPYVTTEPVTDQLSSPPANEIEAKIAGIWQEVLGIARAGREDRFFDLGGHSLLAVKALRLLRDAFEKDIAITDLFRFPTVSALAAHLAEPTSAAGLAQSQQRGAARRDRLARRREPRHD
jgi:natural product biosynthesis luciferase-like monooxygenase protein